MANSNTFEGKEWVIPEKVEYVTVPIHAKPDIKYITHTELVRSITGRQTFIYYVRINQIVKDDRLILSNEQFRWLKNNLTSLKISLSNSLSEEKIDGKKSDGITNGEYTLIANDYPFKNGNFILGENILSSPGILPMELVVYSSLTVVLKLPNLSSLLDSYLKFELETVKFSIPKVSSSNLLLFLGDTLYTIHRGAIADAVANYLSDDCAKFDENIIRDYLNQGKSAVRNGFNVFFQEPSSVMNASLIPLYLGFDLSGIVRKQEKEIGDYQQQSDNHLTFFHWFSRQADLVSNVIITFNQEVENVMIIYNQELIPIVATGKVIKFHPLFTKYLNTYHPYKLHQLEITLKSQDPIRIPTFYTIEYIHWQTHTKYRKMPEVWEKPVIDLNQIIENFIQKSNSQI